MCFLQRLDSKRTELGIAGYIYRILVSHPILVDSHIDTLQLAGYSRSSNVVVVAFVFLSTRMAVMASTLGVLGHYNSDKSKRIVSTRPHWSRQLAMSRTISISWDLRLPL